MKTFVDVEDRGIAKERFDHSEVISTLYFTLFHFRATFKLVDVSPFHISRRKGIFHVEK